MAAEERTAVVEESVMNCMEQRVNVVIQHDRLRAEADNKTVAMMTPEEANVLSTTAGKSILKEAKKELRVQAFKVHFIFVT